MTKKISGTYKDNQDFKHVVFWAGKGWIDSLYNPSGLYCSHTHITSEQIKAYLSYLKKVV